MKKEKFISKEMAIAEANSVLFYLFLKFNHVSLSATHSTGTIEVTVYPKNNEEVNLPKGYITSYEKEEWIGHRYKEASFKVKRYYFYFNN